ncbi:MAG: sodium-dependent transporter [Akkermansia sp.]
MSQADKSEHWKSKLGVILAVSGAAVGFGNFLRFPGLASEYGGAAFMVAYFASFFLLGIPLAWLEWSIGRHGGQLNAHSAVGVYHKITRNKTTWKIFGIVSIMVTLGIAMYYIYLEAWALGYAYHTLMGNLQLSSSAEFVQFFNTFTGAGTNGAAFDLSKTSVLIFLLIALVLNFIVIYRGLSKGIELFCKICIPMLILCAVIILVRVLTLGTPDANYPNRNIDQALGYMWNPDRVMLQATIDGKNKTLDMLPAGSTPAQEAQLIADVQAQYPKTEIRSVHITFWQGLMNPELWLAAAGQVFYTLSFGQAVILGYASYVRKEQDIALSGISAAAINELAEVGLAGMIIVPAASAFLGVAAAAGCSTFGLGFNVLPQVFATMPGGQIFGFLFFLLLFIAAISSSISFFIPTMTLVSDYIKMPRLMNIILTLSMILIGTAMVIWFTEDNFIALDTIDSVVVTLGLFISTAGMLYVGNKIWGTDNVISELRQAALMRVPHALYYILRYVTPSILFVIVASWLYQNIFVKVSDPIQRVLDLQLGAVLPLVWVFILMVTFLIITTRKTPLE